MKLNNLIIDHSILLKPLASDDAPVIYDAINTNRAFLRTWLPFVDDTENIRTTRAFVNSFAGDIDPNQKIFTIWYCDDFSGLLGLKDIDYLNQKTEIGYWLIEKMTGKGIMTKSVAKVLDFCFFNLELNRVQIKCGVENIKSNAVPLRLGFTFEGTERQGEKHTRGYIDLKIYSILKKEWLQFT